MKSLTKLAFGGLLTWALWFGPLSPGTSANSLPEPLPTSDISYVGAFRLPSISGPNYATFDYSNGPIVYLPAGDPGGPADGFPGSLLVAGHQYASQLAELAIPTPVNAKNLGSLPTAALIRPMSGFGIGGLLGMTYAHGRVFYAASGDYVAGNCDGNQDGSGSLGSITPAFGDPHGKWGLTVNGARLHQYETSRYIFEVPQTIADALFGGRSLLSGRYRGWCPEGAELFAWVPPATSVGTVPALPLARQGSGRTMVGHKPSNTYRGGAWLSAGTKHAAMITSVYDAGSRGYYGYENWQTPQQCEPSGTCVGHRGWRSGDPQPSLLLFSPADLAAVALGTKSPDSLTFYARLNIAPYLLRTYAPTYLVTGSDGEVLLTAFDRARGLLYLTESYADGNAPVVHVFRVGAGPSSTELPAAPRNLRITG